MKELTAAQIEKLARSAEARGGRRIAVENFLGTLDGSIGEYGNYRNAWADRDSYRWNAATIDAIQKGIVLAFRPA